jgi:quinol monooxygenase YgiN
MSVATEGSPRPTVDCRLCSYPLNMYGLIGKMISKPGQRDALLALLLQGTENMPGCLSYVIAKDTEDDDVVWITEVWENEARHHDSLQLPSVRDAIAKAMPLIARFRARRRHRSGWWCWLALR